MGSPDIISPSTTTGGTPVGGSGTVGTIPVWGTTTTTLTDSPLTVSGSNVTGAGAIRATGTTAGAPAFTGSDTDTGIYFPANNQVRFATAGSPAMSIDASQNVGIGTTSPGAPLDVALATGGGNNTARLLYTGTITANEGAVLGLGGYYTGTTATTFAYIKGAKDNAIAGDFGGNLQFWTRPNGGSFNERMRIDSSGNVGIGTASPWGALTVARAAGSDAYAEFGGGGRTSAAATFIGQDATGSAYLWNRTNQPVYFGTNNLTRAVVGSAFLDISSTAGYGLKLPATPGNADTQTLDCYQENTWTATDGSGAGLTYTVNNTAVYTRVGRLVHMRIDITFPATASGANAAINLPFNAINFGGTGIGYVTTLGLGNFLANGATLEVYNAAGSRQTNANLSGVRIILSLVYQAA